MGTEKADLRSTRLPTKLAAVLARLCHKAGPLTKTKAVKLPYLVDVIATEHLGRQITGGIHQAWDYGVVTREVYRFITYPEAPGPFEIQDHPFSEGAYQLTCEEMDVSSYLSTEELAVVDTVADMYAAFDATSLGLLTKSLNPELASDAWGSNRRARIDEAAYTRLSEHWPELLEKLKTVDLTDQSMWGEPVVDARAYVRELFAS